MRMTDARDRIGAVGDRLWRGFVWVDCLTSAPPAFIGRRLLRFGASVVDAKERLRGERGTVAEEATTGALMSLVSALVLVWYVDLRVGYTLDPGVYGLVGTAFGSFWVTTAAIYGVRNEAGLEGRDGRTDTDKDGGSGAPGREGIPGYVRPHRDARARIPTYVRPDRVVPSDAALDSVRRVTVLGVGAVLFTLGVAAQVIAGLGPPLASTVGIDGSVVAGPTLDRGFIVVVGILTLTVDFREVLGDWKDWTLLWYVAVVSALVGLAYGLLGAEAAGAVAVAGAIVLQTAAVSVLVYHLLLAVRTAVGPVRNRLPYERGS